MGIKGKYVPKKILTGQKFGKLTVIEYAGYEFDAGNRAQHLWKCACDCGGEKIVQARLLLSGHCKSCGCIPHLPKNITWIKHHLTDTPLYNVWKSMKGRCYTKSNSAYKHYGARGITVCEEWKKDFTAFYKWAIANGYDPNKPGRECTLDRIDVNGNYEPSNCRWATMITQANNKTDTVLREFQGEMLTTRQISEITGVPYRTIKGRIDQGFSIYEAVYGSPNGKKIHLWLNNEKHTIKEWASITGLKTITIRARLARGWSVEKALTTPASDKGKDLWKYRKDRKEKP